MSIKLHTSITQPWGAQCLSPFGTKLETYLRAKGAAFEKVPVDMRKAPKGKIPFVTFEDGRVMGDSQLIIEHLERTQPPPMDEHLKEADRVVGHVTRRMLDEAYYFVVMYARWFEDASWEHQKVEFAKVLPGPLRVLLPLIRSSTKKKLSAQGTSRHSPEEVMAMGLKDLEAASKLLGDRPYLFGDHFSTYDCSLFAFVDGTAVFPRDSVLKQFVSSSNLKAYRERIRAKYFA